MEQRTSVMISAIVFAAVVAGAIAYLVYTRPSDDNTSPELAISPLPTMAPLGEIAIASPSPELEFKAVEITSPTPSPRVAAAVTPSAPTGPAELTLIATIGSMLLGAVGIRRLAA